MLHAARCGTIRVDSGLLDGGDPDGRTRLSGELRAVPSMCFVLEHPEATVVWDTSMHPAVCTDPVGHWGPLAESVTVPEYVPDELLTARIALLGIDVEAVGIVLNSHLHNDHCGMNRFFPGATVMGRRCEVEHAEAQMTNPISGYVEADFHGDGQRRELFDYDDRHDVFGDGIVELVSTIGHTPGHQSLAITFPSGRRFVLTGDAVYTTTQLATGAPPGLTWDRDAAIESSRHLGRLAADDATTLLVPHDPATWAEVGDVATVWSEER